MSDAPVDVTFEDASALYDAALEVEAWTRTRGGAAKVRFRSSELAPPEAAFDSHGHVELGHPGGLAFVDTRRIVERLVAERRQRLRALGAGLLFERPPLAQGGHMLVYVPEHNLADGAALVCSDGFFDGNNCPPWDLWLAALAAPPSSPWPGRWLLLSWIPADIVAVAQRGVDVNPEACIAFVAVSG